MSKGWETTYGGKLEFVTDAAEVVRRTLEHIDKKRAALKLPPYDPSRFGQSGDTPLQPYFELPLEQQMAELYG